MSIDAFEQEQMLHLRANVLRAEQERLNGASTVSVSEAKKQLRKRISFIDYRITTSESSFL